MRTIAIIPARYASTRLPGKMLLSATGTPLIVHVLEAVRKARSLQDVVVATDDQRILSAVQAHGGKAVMTRADHQSGSDRLAEAAGILGLADDDVVINVQGDEPDMPADCIDTLAELINSTIAPMATLATPLDPSQAGDPNRVKVVLDVNGRAMYFSRATIPFNRDRSQLERRRGQSQTAGQSPCQSPYLLHLGIYAYRAGFLKTFTALPQTPAEKSEKLEQLRALEHGYPILVAVVDYHGCGIDTPQDYERFVERFKSQNK